jgi:hypothetical protein
MTEKPKASGTVRIAASPETVYAMVSDLTRMGEWSPEATGGEWLGGATCAAVGAKFKGSNANGDKKWKAVSTITEASEPTRFAFMNGIGPLKTAEWRYEITPVDGGAACEVTESWQLHAPGLIGAVGKFATGVADRPAHTQAMIDTTLARLKESAESGG